MRSTKKKTEQYEIHFSSDPQPKPILPELTGSANAFTQNINTKEVHQKYKNNMRCTSRQALTKSQSNPMLPKLTRTGKLYPGAGTASLTLPSSKTG